MIQVRLWTDCYNNCLFCSIKNKGITKLEDKRERLKRLSELKESKIGIIGGEFFEGQLKGIEEDWLESIKNLNCDNLFITANLINDQYLLKETLNIRPDIQRGNRHYSMHWHLTQSSACNNSSRTVD